MRPADTPACRPAREWLSAVRDGHVPAPDGDDARQRAHAAGCPACAAWVRGLERAARAAPEVYAGPPPGVDTVAAAVTAFAARARTRRAARERAGALVLALAGVAGVVLTGLSLAVADGGHYQQDLLGFQLALSVGFLLCARDPARYVRGLLVVTAAASLVVLLPSAADTVTGGRDLLAEASHLPVLGGLLGLLLLLGTLRDTPRRLSVFT